MKILKHVSENNKDYMNTYKELWPQIYKFIYYKVQNKEEAEELTQDVFKKAYERIDKSEIENIKAYLFTCARNTIYDSWRKKYKTPNLVRIEDLKDKGYQLEEINSKYVDQNLIVKEMFSKLDKEDRQIIKLRILDGYTVKQVAKKLKKPPGTIKSRQYRALKKLKKYLNEGGYFNG